MAADGPGSRLRPRWTPWVVPALSRAGGQSWKTECRGEVAQPPGALDSGLHRTQRQPREPPSNCCARQRRPGGLGGSSSAVSGRGHGEGALGTAGARRGALPPVPPWNHPHFSTFLVCRLIETIFSQVCSFSPTGRPPVWGTRLCLLSVTVTFPGFTTCPVPKNSATET